MAQRKLTNGEAKPCRHETTFKEYMDQRGITNDLTPAEKMEKLTSLFECFARPARMISDNLQPGLFQERIGETKLSGMQALLEANEHAVELLRDCVEEMGRCSLSRVNGTSEAFSRCNKTYVEEVHRLEIGRKELGDFIRQQCGTVANDMHTVADGAVSSGSRDYKGNHGLKPVVACALIQAASIFLVFEEMIAA